MATNRSATYNDTVVRQFALAAVLGVLWAWLSGCSLHPNWPGPN